MSWASDNNRKIKVTYFLGCKSYAFWSESEQVDE